MRYAAHALQMRYALAVAKVNPYRLDNFRHAVPNVAGTIFGIDLNEAIGTSNNRALPHAWVQSSYPGYGVALDELHHIIEPRVVAASVGEPTLEQHVDELVIGNETIARAAGVSPRTWERMGHRGYRGATFKLGQVSFTLANSAQACVSTYTYKYPHGNVARFK